MRRSPATRRLWFAGRAGEGTNLGMEASADRSIFTDDLSRHFGRLRAVQHMDVAVRSGEIFGLLGPNGSGKSTLMKVLTTLLAPSAGLALVAGHDVSREGDKVRRAIGVALQEVSLDPCLTARELLLLQARLSGMRGAGAKQRVEYLLRAMGLIGAEPRKLVRNYSAGLKRRLDLALALANRPGILFLDEPTSGVDPAGRAAIWEEVERLNREEGMTVFLSTQNLGEADYLAHRVAIIRQGMVVAEGTPLELKSALGNEVVSLSFATPELAVRAADALAGVADRQQMSGRDVFCYVGEAGPSVPVMVRRLDQAAVPLGGLTVRQPSLEDVFLRAIGERMPVGSVGHPAGETAVAPETTA